MKRSSVLFTELDRRLSVANNGQNKRKYNEENKKNAGKIDKEKKKQRDFDKGTIKQKQNPLNPIRNPRRRATTTTRQLQSTI